MPLMLLRLSLFPLQDTCPCTQLPLSESGRKKRKQENDSSTPGFMRSCHHTEESPKFLLSFDILGMLDEIVIASLPTLSLLLNIPFCMAQLKTFAWELTSAHGHYLCSFVWMLLGDRQAESKPSTYKWNPGAIAFAYTLFSFLFSAVVTAVWSSSSIA